MKAIRFLSISLLIIVVYFGMQPEPAKAQQTKRVILAGYKHSPSVATSGSGLITVSAKGDTLWVNGEFSDLTSTYTGAYIMIGKEGEYGNMLFRLTVDLNDERTGGVLKKKANTYTLSEAQKPLLKNGELFINIISADHRKGELRGQIPAIK
ncbi:CHRD domain-containing protein [Fodinibius salsisoli]|uniref:CHRD domain-containing protein n=1 Tax=Fodinibius salsisoli TaxID=2820877 RepID=A0ABT3PM78_9BACT|nr:CHRD domain-containing protein [Fodinibius salsisoli]MCW9707027.1 CHRD domain-containing protein [Fodinibius salsisoli]